jgi:hypothetical protein
LVEAEGRSLRQATVEVGFRLLLLAFAGMLLTAGVALSGWALYEYLLTMLGAAFSALLVGLLAIVIGGGMIWQIRRNCR